MQSIAVRNWRFFPRHRLAHPRQKPPVSIEPLLVTGPATDNAVGIEQIAERLNLPGINALSNGVALGDAIADALHGASS